MPYTYANLNDALTALSERLYDNGIAGQPAFQQWTQTELTGYVQEALRTWNALSGFHRTAMSFNLSQGAFFYDLHAQNNTVVPLSVTQNSVVVQIENHLLEPPTTSYPLTWTGSNQIALADILEALQRRQDETLGTAGCTIASSLVAASDANKNTTLGDNTIDIRRVAWVPDGNNYTTKILRQSDAWAERAFDYSYTSASPQPPRTWYQSTEPPISFSVDYLPPTTGNYNILTVQAGPAWTASNNSANAGTTIPDDWTWVLKWGALFDVLSRESSAKDILRSEYCRKRYTEGQALLQQSATVLALKLNGSPMAIDAVTSGDEFNPSWQSNSNLAPTAAYLTANLVAFGSRRIPEGASGNNWSGNYTAAVTVVQNAPVPQNGTDFIQVAKDDYDSVIDYAQHLAMFKQGGYEFLATIPLYQKFQRKAALYNSKLSEMGFFEWPMQDLGTLEEKQNARYSPGNGPGEAAA